MKTRHNDSLCVGFLVMKSHITSNSLTYRRLMIQSAQRGRGRLADGNRPAARWNSNPAGGACQLLEYNAVLYGMQTRNKRSKVSTTPDLPTISVISAVRR